MLRNIKISHRSVLFFGLLGILTLLLGIYALKQINNLGNISDDLSELRLPQVTLTGEIRRDFLTLRLYAANYALSNDTQQKQLSKDTLNEAITSLTNNSQALNALMDTDGKGPELLAEVDKYTKQYHQYFLTWAQAIESGDISTDRKSTRLNSSHVRISYAVFCLKKKKQKKHKRELGKKNKKRELLYNIIRVRSARMQYAKVQL